MLKPCDGKKSEDPKGKISTGMTQERRTLPNWTGLLDWSTKYHDGTSASRFGPMDSDRRLWLEKALNAAFDGGEDPNQIMRKAVAEIQDGRISVGLDMLDHVSDFPDCAENIDTIGALMELINLLKSEDRNVVKRTCEVLNYYLPNNPKIQLSAAVKYNCISNLKSCLEERAQDNELISSFLSVLANVIRNVTPLENGFIREGGISFVSYIVRSRLTVGSVQKVCGLLLSLSQRHDLSSHKKEMEDMLFFVYNSDALPKDNVQVFETLAGLVAWLGASDILRDAIRIRLGWIESLDLTQQEQFTGERDLLVDCMRT
jgi:hypothetical protein